MIDFGGIAGVPIAVGASGPAGGVSSGGIPAPDAPAGAAFHSFFDAVLAASEETIPADALAPAAQTASTGAGGGTHAVALLLGQDVRQPATASGPAASVRARMFRSDHGSTRAAEGPVSEVAMAEDETAGLLVFPVGTGAQATPVEVAPSPAHDATLDSASPGAREGTDHLVAVTAPGADGRGARQTSVDTGFDGWPEARGAGEPGRVADTERPGPGDQRPADRRLSGAASVAPSQVRARVTSGTGDRPTGTVADASTPDPSTWAVPSTAFEPRPGSADRAAAEQGPSVSGAADGMTDPRATTFQAGEAPESVAGPRDTAPASTPQAAVFPVVNIPRQERADLPTLDPSPAADDDLPGVEVVGVRQGDGAGHEENASHGDRRESAGSRQMSAPLHVAPPTLAPPGGAPAAMAAPPAAAVPLTDDQGEQVTSQIVQSMRTQLRGGIGEAVVRLKPEYLGEVTITVRVARGQVEASVKAELPAVREWLEAQEPAFRQSLGEQGLSLTRLRVEPDGERTTGGDGRQEQPSSNGRRPRQQRDSEERFELLV